MQKMEDKDACILKWKGQKEREESGMWKKFFYLMCKYRKYILL